MLTFPPLMASLGFGHLPSFEGDREGYLVYETSQAIPICQRFLEGNAVLAELDAWFIATALENSLGVNRLAGLAKDSLRWSRLKQLLEEFPSGFDSTHARVDEQTGMFFIGSGEVDHGIHLQLLTPPASWNELGAHILKAADSLFNELVGIGQTSH